MSKPLYFIVEIQPSARFGDIMELERILRRMGARAKRIRMVELSPDEEADIIRLVGGER